MRRPPPRHGLGFLRRASILVGALFAGAAARADSPSPARPRPAIEVDAEVEHYTPTHAHRHVNSIFHNVLVGIEAVRVIHLSISGGLTFTSAWGDIVQPGENDRDTTYRADAIGLGPAFLLRCVPLQVGRFAVGAEILGSLIFYDRHFPPGGDLYNLSWRLGGSASFRIDDHLRLVAGARWMHVSNGQGLGPQNPSYEGLGTFVGVHGRW